MGHILKVLEDLGSTWQRKHWPTCSRTAVFEPACNLRGLFVIWHAANSRNRKNHTNIGIPQARFPEIAMTGPLTPQ